MKRTTKRISHENKQCKNKFQKKKLEKTLKGFEDMNLNG